MDWNHPIIAVIGAGAVGGYYGARLAQHGHAVHFLFRGDYEAVRRHGLTIKSRDGDCALSPAAIHAYNDSRQMPKADLILVTLKTTSNDQYEPLIRPLLHNDTAILTLQNGLGNEQRLADLFGPARILGGLAFVCINRREAGVIEHTDYGLITLGEFTGGPSPRASRIAQIFKSSRVPCRVLDDLRYGRWEKLVWNIPFNGLSAAMDLTTDRLVGTPEGIELIRAIMAEVVAAARANGVNLPADIIDKNIQRTLTMGPYRTSMHIDRQLGRRLEVEAILGEPLRAAHAAGVATPALEMLYRIVRLVK